MDPREFELIKDKTWLRITPPDDPFKSREYKVISKVEKMSDEEKRKYAEIRHIQPPNYKAYVYAEIGFTPDGWVSPGYKVYFPERAQYISDWDISHATKVKKITRKTYSDLFNDIFEGKVERKF